MEIHIPFQTNLVCYTGNIKDLFEKIMKFGAIGILNTVLSFIIFNVVSHVLMWRFLGFTPEVTGQLIICLILVPFSFFMNNKFTFKSKRSKRKTMPLFLLSTYFSSGVLQTSLIWFFCVIIAPLGLKDWFIFHDNWVLFTNFALIMSTCVGMVWNFVTYHFIFGDDKKQNIEE